MKVQLMLRADCPERQAVVRTFTIEIAKNGEQVEATLKKVESLIKQLAEVHNEDFERKHFQ